MRKDIKKEEKKPIPDGAEIISKNITTEVEEIENGFLTSVRTEIRYRIKSSKDTYGDYWYETKKYYTEDDPLTVSTNNKSLAEAFKE